jgi:aspartyl-tRNA(Asn)/glutamyl-tRNA(Gln) amidotransferase subunit A
MTDLSLKNIGELAGLISSGDVSPVELTELMLARIEALDGQLNTYITVMRETALEQARAAEREIRSGNCRGPLHGIPYAAKDLFFTKGTLTTAGSKIFADFVPEYDATVVTKLHDAGAILLGKTGLHENAYGITSTNPHYGAVRNPWDTGSIPGGSSGGSAAAQAAGLCSFSLGTDTGGSIRIPAAFCGVSGLKPTFGRVSRYGVFPLSHTLDHVGPFAWTAEDLWHIFAAMAGRDRQDESTVERPMPEPQFLAEPSLRGRRIGVPRNFYFENLDPEVEAANRAALTAMEALGADLVDVKVPDIEEFNLIARLIQIAEASSVHVNNLNAHREDYGDDQQTLLDQGMLVTAVDYLNAQRRRRQLNSEFYNLFEEVDAIAAPAVAILPAKIGQRTIEVGGIDEDVRMMTTRNARALNLTGLPLLTLPCGFSASGLPIGLQLAGKLFDECSVLEIGSAYQQVTDWHERRPAIATP